MAKSKKKTKAKSNSIFQRIDELKKNHHALFLISVVLFIITFAYAAETTGIEDAMKQLCKDARSVLAIGVMLMVIMAAVVYAIGQILGAETRARASVWATAMMTGAVIAIIIYLVVPNIIGIMAPDLDVEDACGTGGTGSGSESDTASKEMAIKRKPPPGKEGPVLPPGEWWK